MIYMYGTVQGSTDNAVQIQYMSQDIVIFVIVL